MESLADLRSSIAKLGVQQPVVVRKLAALRGLAAYELVAGERRYRAAGQAGLAHIPAVIRQLTDEEVLEVQLVENLQREDLHPLEEAAGYEELMKVAKLKKEELGDKVGKSRSWVYSRLNLLKLPKECAGRAAGRAPRRLARPAGGERRRPEQRDRCSRWRSSARTTTTRSYSVRQLRAEVLKDRLTFPLIGAPFPTTTPRWCRRPARAAAVSTAPATATPRPADPDVCTNVPCYHLKVKAHGDNRRAEVLAKGGKVLKGEDARKISPSVKTCYGHVDLDLVCEHDDFPEPEPEGRRLRQRATRAWSPGGPRRGLAAAHLPRAPRRPEVRLRPDRRSEDQAAARARAVQAGPAAAEETERHRSPVLREQAAPELPARRRSSPTAAKKDPAKEAAEQQRSASSRSASRR
jgi:ParB/RepB/Spo0J family partition protein